ncbi:MAG: aspartate aminotransferase family protein [Cyclobacteriaceae bacterium]|nr:aspartate aminotransferase family protein [Cyclobacteriaceae bacterium]
MAKLTDKIQALYDDKHFESYRRFPLTLIKGRGTRVYDTEGKSYLDALAGIAVNNVGHCHPKVVSAIKEQAENLIHVSNLYYNIPQSTLANLLTEVSGFDRVFFCNSGLEANEAALKIVRKYGQEKGKTGPVVYFTGCFHGRSIATVTMGKKDFQKGFGPMPQGFMELPYNDMEALDQIADDTKAIFVECVQGEGGVNIGQKDFLRKIGQICKEKEILLVVDEVQTGMGRTGKMFAYEHFDIEPDIITLAKGLGAGMPIGAVLANSAIAKVIQPGDHGSTFGGNPVSCAAAIASLEVILEDGLLENASETGTYLLNKIKELARDYGFIKEVRGVGLMIGIDFDTQCRSVAVQMMEQGLLVSCTALHVIRIVPPLILSIEEADEIVSILSRVFEEIEEFKIL